MMGMMGVMMVFMVLGTVFFLVVLAVVIWLLASFLNKQQRPPMPYTPQWQNPYQRYEQGYQPPQPLSEIYQDGGRQDRYPQPKQQFDQSSVPYPQEREMPPRGQ